MLELIESGGWLMLPIILCSIIATAIVGERFWALQRKRICPKGLVHQIWLWARNKQLDAARIGSLRSSSPLGRILAAGLVNLHHEREIMKESIEETGRHVVLELERYLNTLGTIASITPLLGLLGTVFGMIKVFAAIEVHGVGNAGSLAGGISQALITTAAGLSVAIPTLMFYRYFRGRVQALVSNMEEEALKLIEVLHGEREGEILEDDAAMK
ncbi:MAG TPA: MotA/TolQ/ExbB proton channel family protein [Gammaproteobacteria bacterium]|nr:MotA/TolQ/ExbB proton channel family protein [Gammaproteobacteria bacterium]